MSAVRGVLGAVGVAMIAWGAWLALDLRPGSLVSVVTWAAGAVIVHDLLLAPLVVAAGVGIARFAPPPSRTPVALLLAGWALVTAASLGVLSGQGGKPDNASLLTGDYLAWWGGGTVVVALLAVALVVRGRRVG